MKTTVLLLILSLYQMAEIKPKSWSAREWKKIGIVQYIHKDKTVTLTKLMATAESRREVGEAKLEKVILEVNQKRRTEF